jgi:hypothetical protein
MAPHPRKTYMFVWSVRFEVLMAVIMGITILRDGMLCGQILTDL